MNIIGGKFYNMQNLTRFTKNFCTPWYKNYFIALAPKLEVGGCFTAHNASNTGSEGIREFIDYVTDLPNFKTTVDTTSRAGISISNKIAEN